MLLLQRADGQRSLPVVRFANRAFGELTGRKLDGLAGRSLRALRSVIEPDESFAGLVTATLTGEPFGGRLRLRTAAGVTMSALARGQALSRDTDQYAVWVEIAPESDTPSVQAVVADSFQLLAAVSRDCFYELTVEVDCRLRLVWADPRLVALTGYELDELQAMGGFFGVVAAADHTVVYRRNQQLLTGQAAPIRYRLRRKTGELRWVQDTARAVRETDGAAVVRIVGTLADASEDWHTSLPASWLEQEAAMLAELMQADLLLLDGEGRVLWASDGCGRLRGQIGATLAALLPSSLLNPWLDWLDEAQVVHQPVRCRLAWAGPDGDEPVEAYLVAVGEDRLQLVVWPAEPASTAPARAFGLAEAAAPERPVSPPSNGDSWLEAVMNSVADGLLLLDTEGTITWLSRSAETILEVAHDSAIGTGIDSLLPPGPDTEGALLERLRAPASGRVPFELTIRRRSGELVPVEVESGVALQRGRQMIVLVVRDLTGRRQTEETLRSLAYHDPLTGLPNRLLFHDRLSQAIERAKRARQLLTVMLVDLDRFKLINDSLGLETGDQIIKGVADRLVQTLRKSDTVARLGGDEFMLLLLGTNGAEAAAKVAQKVLEALRPSLQVDAHELTTSASVGIALFPHDGDDADTLIKNAANALSRAKEQGRNHYQFYTDDMNAAAFERLMLESRLRKALEQGEFVIYYQPKVSLADGAVLGVEALLRWFHPDLGLVPPAEFIPLAEETGLIVPIGAWVLRTACAQVRRWHRMGHARLELAVNISARQFQEKDLVATIAAAVDESGIAADLLELELTESVIMRDAPEAARRLKELTALGLRLAIDDFGTGYSSLGYLKAFPISTLKIDRSFVRDVDRDPNSAALAQAIIALASSLKLKVVAEGVETREQQDLLRACGCQEMQGYLFSRPLPPEELLALLEQGRRLQI